MAPSVETLVELVRACGFDLPLLLVPHDTSLDEQLRANLRLTPERRVDQLVAAAEGKTLRRRA